MKKSKSLIITAILVAVCSAFSINTAQVDEYTSNGGCVFIWLDPAKRGQAVPGGWDCFRPWSPVCTWTLKPGATPPYDCDDFEPFEINKTFAWIIPPIPK